MALDELLRTIVVPRPNGSPALEGVAKTLLDNLQGTGGKVSTEVFSARPQAYFWLGAALFVLALLICQTLLTRRHRAALFLACLAVLLYGLEAVAGLPLLTAIGQKPAENLVLDWSPEGLAVAPVGATGAPPGSASPLVILTAHYDSRTDLFAPATTRSLAAKAPIALFILVAVAALAYLAERSRSLGFFDYGAGRSVLLFLAWVSLAGLGAAGAVADVGHATSSASPGAIDNAGSLAVLVQVARDLPNLGLEQTRVRVVFFPGEEAGCQGSAAYVRSHPELHASGRRVWVINLEELGAGGRLAYRGWGGSPLRRGPASEETVDLINRALVAGTTEPPLGRVAGARDDAGSFIAAGTPALTLTESRFAEREVAHTAADTADWLVPEDLDRVAKALELTLVIVDLEASLFTD